LAAAEEDSVFVNTTEKEGGWDHVVEFMHKLVRLHGQYTAVVINELIKDVDGTVLGSGGPAKQLFPDQHRTIQGKEPPTHRLIGEQKSWKRIAQSW
jgi:hypothetical protein